MGTFQQYQQFIIDHGWNSNYWRKETLNYFYRTFTKEEFEEFRKKYNNIISKRYRIIKKFKSWNKEKLWFTTLTIAPKYENRSKRTFTDTIKEIYKNIQFVANEDYGTTRTQRLHYHVMSEGKPNLEKWIYGYTYLEKVRQNCDSEDRIGNYIIKMANHTIKNSAGGIIYSRKGRKHEKKEDRKNN